MAKFSILRDEDDDEDEDEDEFFFRSPKRRRTFQPPPSCPPEPNPHPPSNDVVHHHHHDADDDDVECSTNSGSMSVILSDPDVLDCSICFNPLTLPVFQCDNGHIVCASCCTKLENKCPSCCGSIGYNRCRAIEKVIESVRVACYYSRYGCKEIVGYSERHKHEEICTYAPCSCPFPDCLFRGSPKRLSFHMGQKHADFVVRFHYNTCFPVSVGLDDKFVVLQEERDGILFILNHGNTVTVKCIDPLLSKERFAYGLELHKGSSFLKFQSFTHCTTGQVNPTTSDYFLVPGYFYDSGGFLKLEICIWEKDQSHA